MKKTLVLLLMVVVCSLCSHSLSFGQTPFTTHVYIVNGTDKDTLTLGVATTATYGIDSTTLGEKEAPPLPPVDVFDTRFKDPRYSGVSPIMGQGLLKKDIRHLTSDCQIDTFRIHVQVPTTTASKNVTYTWNVAGLGCGRWRLTNSLNPNLTSIDVDMLQQTSVTVGNDTVPDIYIRKSDGTQYRTFDMATLALDGPVDAKGKHSYGKSVKPAVNQAQFCVSFTNTNAPTVVVNDLHVVFGEPVDSASLSVTHFTHVATSAKEKAGKKVTYTFSGTTIDSGVAVQICGYGAGAKAQTVKSYFWSRNDTALSKAVSGKNYPFDNNTLRLPMPNTVNAGEELFAQIYPKKPTPTPLVIGDVGSKTSPAWVTHSVYADVLKSLVANPGKAGKQLMHDTLPTAFTKFDTKTGLRTGKAMAGQLKALPPTSQRNSLFGQALTLAVNLGMSSTQKVPAGLGGLVINIPTSPANGWSLDSLLAKTSEFLTSGTVAAAPTITAAQLEALCQNVNTAFNGVIDTMSWGGTKVKFTPVSHIGDLGGWLMRVPGVEPKIIADLTGSYGNTPEQYSLSQNYPNPFNPTTTIQFSLSAPAEVTIKVFNVIGQEVATLVNHAQYGTGTNAVEFNATNMPSGVYFYRINVTDNANQPLFQEVKKMVLLK